MLIDYNKISAIENTKYFANKPDLLYLQITGNPISSERTEKEMV